METIKKYASLLYGLIIVILGGILLNRNRKLQSAESELAKEKSGNEIRGNDNDRKIAKDVADDLLAEYERIRGDK